MVILINRISGIPKILLPNLLNLIYLSFVSTAVINTVDNNPTDDNLLKPNPGFPNSLEESKRLLFETLNALDNGIGYMGDQYSHINLDGVIGTRIVEGQLEVLLNHLNTGDYSDIPHDAHIQIRQIIQSAGEVSQVASFFVQVQQQKYYDRIGGILVKDFWTLDYPARVTDSSLLTKPQYPDESMREKDSDDCLTELLGTDGHSKCEVSDHCWKLMTSPGYRFYSLSHEVFYLQIGESAGCFHGDQLSVTDPLVSGFCTNMLKEAQTIEYNGYPVQKRDLFMEQQALCGMAGFRDFFSEKWLQKILDWQWGEGCWGEHGLPETDTHATGRVKREEKVLSGGCESHRTAVAISALSQYVRYLVSHISQLSQ